MTFSWNTADNGDWGALKDKALDILPAYPDRQIWTSKQSTSVANTTWANLATTTLTGVRSDENIQVFCHFCWSGEDTSTAVWFRIYLDNGTTTQENCIVKCVPETSDTFGGRNIGGLVGFNNTLTGNVDVSLQWTNQTTPSGPAHSEKGVMMAYICKERA